MFSLLFLQYIVVDMRDIPGFSVIDTLEILFRRRCGISFCADERPLVPHLCHLAGAARLSLEYYVGSPGQRAWICDFGKPVSSPVIVSLLCWDSRCGRLPDRERNRASRSNLLEKNPREAILRGISLALAYGKNCIAFLPIIGLWCVKVSSAPWRSRNFAWL